MGASSRVSTATVANVVSAPIRPQQGSDLIPRIDVLLLWPLSLVLRNGSEKSNRLAGE